MRNILGSILFLALLLSPSSAGAQESQDVENAVTQVHLVKARVASTTTLSSETEPWSGKKMEQQLVQVEVLEGSEKGATPVFRNDFIQVKEGDLVYVRHEFGGFDLETWALMDPYRLNVLAGVALGFLLLLIAFGGIQGLRGLASLLGSMVLIFYVLLPGIFSGHSPILVSIGVASLIIILGSYITHGYNRTTTIAMVSMVLTVMVVGAATYWVIGAAQLSGFTTEENAYLSFGTQGNIDMLGLLFGGIMIGLLGVLYDIAIGQAIAVEELVAAGAHYTRTQVLERALRIGREHIGALVNTLAIAYVGAALPLLLLFKHASDTSILYILNSERFATEIIRILMGSSGLVLAVPVTTFLATYLLYGREVRSSMKGHSHVH